MPPKSRIDCIQLLRAVAAIAVIFDHLPVFGNGAWGVELFFVISGFIMCYVTEDSGRHFLAKRLIRIVPLYWAGTIGVFCVALVAPHLLKNTTPDFISLIKSLFFIPFQKGEAVQPVLFLGWTLNYEMFFYLLFALSLKLNHRHRALICSALLIALVVLGKLIPLDSVIFTFFTRPLLLEFVFGMLCHALLTRTLAFPERHAFLSRLPWIAMGTALVAGLSFITVSQLTNERVIWWGIPAACAFYCIVRGLSGIRLPRPIVLVGDASYSLYLFHPYVIQLFDRSFKGFTFYTMWPYLTAILTAALCCALAVLSYQYLEKPVMKRLRKRFISRQGSGALESP